MEIYLYDHYLRFLQDQIDRKKRMDSRYSFASLAKRIGVQRSFFSAVLKGRAHFSMDQLYLLGMELEISDSEMEYILLLLEIARCQNEKRRKFLLQRRNKMRDENLNSDQALTAKSGKISAKSRSSTKKPETRDLGSYHSNIQHSIVHMYLSIPEYLQNPFLLTRKLGINAKDLQCSLDLLEEAGIIESHSSGYKMKPVHPFIDESSPQFRQYSSGFRVKALDALQKFDPRDHFVTLCFTADEETRMEIRRKFLAFLKEISQFVEEAPSRGVFHMNFDLFKLR